MGIFYFVRNFEQKIIKKVGVQRKEFEKPYILFLFNITMLLIDSINHIKSVSCPLNFNLSLLS